ncbi:MAG: hypothetical protein AAGC73_01920 [Verrucomicrobiota bacterium]
MKTFEEATEFVLKHKLVTVFGSKLSPLPSLWDNTDLSEEKPAGGGWNPKVVAVWDWKTRIPQTYPDDVFYGKVAGGDAVLMRMDYLREHHYPQAYQPMDQLPELCQQIYECIRVEPMYAGEVRKLAIERFHTTKSRFNTAMKKLQISLNIVRSMDPVHENDYWLPFSDVHLDIIEMYPEFHDSFE